MIANWEKIGAIASIMGLGGAVVVWMFKMLYAVIRTFAAMQLSLHTIATNDLPHIYAEIQDMRKEFLDYIKETRGQS